MLFNKTRLILSSLCAVSALFFPWWMTLLIALALCARFRAWEVVPIGVALDFMWHSTFSFSLYGLPLATMTAFALLILFEPVRRELLVGPTLPR